MHRESTADLLGLVCKGSSASEKPYASMRLWRHQAADRLNSSASFKILSIQMRGSEHPVGDNGASASERLTEISQGAPRPNVTWSWIYVSVGKCMIYGVPSMLKPYFLLYAPKLSSVSFSSDFVPSFGDDGSRCYNGDRHGQIMAGCTVIAKCRRSESELQWPGSDASNGMGKTPSNTASIWRHVVSMMRLA